MTRRHPSRAAAPAASAALLGVLALAPAAAAQQPPTPPSATAAAAAPGESCRVPYAAFEEAVPHLDLEACPSAPTGPGAEGAFCRLTVAGDRFTVFEFRPRGTGAAAGPCLVRAEAMSAADFLARHGATTAGPAADPR